MRSHSKTIDAKLVLSIVATGIMSFAGVLIETAMNVTFPALMDEFAIGSSTVQWVTSGYLLVLAVIIPASSFLKRRFTGKRLFVAALCFFLVGTALCALAPSFAGLLVGRLIQGVGTGLALPLMFNIVLEQIPADKLGLMMGVASLITAIAPAAGPSLGGFIVNAYGWRMIFIVLIPVLLTAFIMGLGSIRQVRPTEKISFDYKGYGLLVVAFTCFIGAAGLGWLNLTAAGLLVVSFGAAVVFYRRSLGLPSPLLRVRIFQQSSFVLSLAIIFLIQFIVLALGYLIPNYAQLVSGENAFTAGCLLLPGCLVGALLAPVGGRVLDRFGPGRPILLGQAFIVASTGLFALLSRNLTAFSFTLIYLGFTIGQGFSVGNSITNGLRSLPDELSTDGNAAVNTFQQLAGALGTSVAAVIVGAAQTGQPGDIAQASMAGSRQAFTLLFCLAILAMLCALKLFARPAENGPREMKPTPERDD